METVTTCMMFLGQAEEAMRFYVSLFDDGEVPRLEKYGAGEEGVEGTIKHARFTVAGHRLACIDSPPIHDFGFTPSISLFVDCDAEAQVDRLYAALSEGGQVMMPLDTYPFSPKFAWVQDRFGVSWQLMLKPE